MLTSIFSSFDALYAELSYGQKLGFSLGSLKDSNSKAKEDEVSSSTAAASCSSSSVESIQKKKNSIPTPPSQPGREKRTQPPMRPRFAPEFDGIHCFETIVPY